jgi:Na+-transporting NADH:ubiquinone oxidoreductase subunit C
MQRDSIANTFVVAVSLCVVCAVLVSSAAVGLRQRQDANKKLDQQKNILLAAGLIDGKTNSKEISETFGDRVEPMLINLDTGAPADGNVAEFDAIKAAKSGDDQQRIVLKEDPARIKTRENDELIYRIKDDSGKTQQYVFPIRGYGLWSTLYGYIALDADMETVNGISYYQHGETPGLGGEVDNPAWKAQWKGKKIYDIAGSGADAKRTVDLKVVKGIAMNDHQIDGLSGASITSKGVENMITFWFGPQGYLPFIQSVTASDNSTGA